MSTYLGNNLISGGSNVPDNTTITMSSSNKLQVVGAKDKNDGNVLNFWTGTKAEYDAIVTKDNNTLYNITDDDTADAYEAYTKSEVDTLLENKADIDFTNVTDSAKSIMANVSMPSGTHIDLTLNASNSTYTAPADGWVTWNWWTTATTISFMHLVNVTSGVGILLVPNQGSAYQQRCYIPVAKGDIFSAAYNNLEAASGTHEKYFRFVYAQGAESEAN